MNILFVAGFSPIVADTAATRSFYEQDLGLPMKVVSDDYVALDDTMDGTKHLGLWPLAAAAQSCFGTDSWPDEVPIPQATLEFEVDDVAGAASELEAKGHTLIHTARTEPWGQEIARLLDPNGLLIGLCHTPWLH
jgi:catechol 2,3-dioxygenase-like lactoylglutathione lyase family enzyme